MVIIEVCGASQWVERYECVDCKVCMMLSSIGGDNAWCLCIRGKVGSVCLLVV